MGSADAFLVVRQIKFFYDQPLEHEGPRHGHVPDD
jgi:hypothetical protein